MKRLFALLVVGTILAALSAPAYAQQAIEDKYLRIPHNFTLFFDGGIAVGSNPVPFKEAWNSATPFQVGFGVSVFPWFDVNFVYSHASYGANILEVKRQIAFLGVDETEGGSITTDRFLGTARFLAVPSQRANPFVEVGLGLFKTSAEAVTVSGREANSTVDVNFLNEMPDVDGISVNFGAGLQYALSGRWSTYIKFIWTINQNSDFAPGNLLLGQNEPEGEPDGNQVFSALSVGLMIRF